MKNRVNVPYGSLATKQQEKLGKVKPIGLIGDKTTRKTKQSEANRPYWRQNNPKKQANSRQQAILTTKQ
jgi:hypothetical protein